MKMERTLIIIKPDAFSKNYTGKIIDIFLENGFKILACKILKLTKKQAEAFYYVHEGKHFFNSLTDFMSSGTIFVMVVERENAISFAREIIGATDPKEAKEGTIRKLFAENKERNAIHGSDSPESAKFEISFFFPTYELIG